MASRNRSDALSLTFSALSDPTRREILAMLAEGEKTVTELVESFSLSQPAISKHLKVLEEAGLIDRRREAQRRPARLQAGPLKLASDWVDQYRQFRMAGWDRLDDYIESAQPDDKTELTEEAGKAKKEELRRPPEWKMF